MKMIDTYLKTKGLSVTCMVALIFIAVISGCSGNGKQPNPSGTLEATEVNLAPSMAGRVLTVVPKLGDKVKAGDTLLILDTELLLLQRRQAETGLLTLDAQKRVLGDKEAAAKLNRDLAVQTLIRLQSLSANGTITAQQLDEATNRRDLTEKQISEIQHNIAALDAERAKINATLALYDRQLKDGVLIAPSAGTVLIRSVEPGEMVTPQSTILRLADLSTLELRVYLAEDELSKVKLGQPMSVSIDAFSGKTFNANVSWISPEAEFTPKNVQTRSARTQLVYAIKLRIENSDGKLAIGMPAEVHL